LGVAVVLVTHDLAVVAEVATRVAVMYAGRLVEYGMVEDIFKGERRHPYVVALVGAIPSVLENGLAVRPIPGQVPNLAALPAGCRFAPRCDRAVKCCYEREPALLADESNHLVACHVVNAEGCAGEP
jgi:peptide/nickel transport system ATP-binding protein